MLKESQDGFGQAMADYLAGRGGYEIIERDDGLIAPSGGPAVYFSGYDDWPPCEQEGLSYVRGRVLDIGCGAGRHALYLQEKGHEVVGIDTSPAAVEVCRQRGLRQVHLLSITQVTARLGCFDTIVMLGNNFGLFANERRCRWLLRRFYRLTSPGGRIIAESRDPYATDDPDHLQYHERNRRRGRMGGQVRIRVRYRRCISPWFDYLMVSPAEMEQLLAPTGWRVERIIDWQNGIYVAVIGKAS